MTLTIADSNFLTGPRTIVPPGPTPHTLDKYFDFLEWSEDGETLLLGTSDLTSRIWGGSVWLFSYSAIKDAGKAGGWHPLADKCQTGAAIDCGVTTGRFLDSPRKFVVGCDSGTLIVLAVHDALSQNGNESQSKAKLQGQGSLGEHNEAVSSIDSLGPKSADIVSCSADKSIKVWDLENLVSKHTYSLAHSHAVTSVSAHPTNTNVFSSCALDCQALLWDIRNPSPASGLMKTEGLGLTSLSWVNDCSVVIGSVSGQLSVVDTRNTIEPTGTLQLSRRPVHTLRSLSGNPSMVGVCQDHSAVSIVQCSESHTPEVLYSHDGHEDFVRGLAWHPSWLTLWSCGWDSKVLAHRL